MSEAADFSKVVNSLSLLKINEILDDPKLEIAEKRAILASWSSDAHAVDDVPWLRQIDNDIFLSVDQILLALKSLDREPPPAPAISSLAA
jgi:hypothetical protein